LYRHHRKIWRAVSLSAIVYNGRDELAVFQKRGMELLARKNAPQ